MRFLVRDDSGLDIDALKVVSKGSTLRGEGFGAMIITHITYNSQLYHSDVVHVMMEGKVVLSAVRVAVPWKREYAKGGTEVGSSYAEEV